ncbi:hypothetical protein BCR35DRAFT_330224 [Leucosporidium creatinivorum]|uniref:F-box domain-containing protein n=1 Tax=Leucosporidium creatinivorum TaxID=106004 RepID=A0A1Y2FWI7_9BASI|nr:hypothetical protein BCR35DRAFT_330224 [Leucosporidium creatinivorum]
MLIVLWYTLSAVLWLLPRWDPPEKPTLPVEIWLEVLSLLDYRSLKRVSGLNRSFQALVKHSSLAEQLFITTTPDQGLEGAPVFLHPLLQGSRILIQQPFPTLSTTILIEKGNRKLLYSHVPLAVLHENATSPPFACFTSVRTEPIPFALKASKPGAPLSVDDAVQSLVSMRSVFARRYDRARSSSSSASREHESFVWELNFKQKEVPSPLETLNMFVCPFIEETRDDGKKVVSRI